MRRLLPGHDDAEDDQVGEATRRHLAAAGLKAVWASRPPPSPTVPKWQDEKDTIRSGYGGGREAAASRPPCTSATRASPGRSSASATAMILETMLAESVALVRRTKRIPATVSASAALGGSAWPPATISAGRGQGVLLGQIILARTLEDADQALLSKDLTCNCISQLRCHPSPPGRAVNSERPTSFRSEAGAAMRTWKRPTLTFRGVTRSTWSISSRRVSWDRRRGQPLDFNALLHMKS